jgi:hypothetical protein
MFGAPGQVISHNSLYGSEPMINTCKLYYISALNTKSATWCSIQICSTYKHSTHSTIVSDPFCRNITRKVRAPGIRHKAPHMYIASCTVYSNSF